MREKSCQEHQRPLTAMQVVKSCYRGLKREDISSEEMKTVVMGHPVEEFGSVKKRQGQTKDF